MPFSLDKYLEALEGDDEALRAQTLEGICKMTPNIAAHLSALIVRLCSPFPSSVEGLDEDTRVQVVTTILDAHPTWISAMDPLTWQTPLHAAVRWDLPKLFAALVERGADPEIKNGLGESVADAALDKPLAPDNPDGVAMFPLLLEKGLVRDTAKGAILKKALDKGDTELAALLFAHGAEACLVINEEDFHPALEYAAELDWQGLQMFRDLGGTLSTVGQENGQNPLHYIGMFHSADRAEEDVANTIEILMLAGCNPLQQGPDGKTPYDVAITAGFEDIADGLKLAMDHYQLQGETLAAPGQRRAARL